MEKNKADNVSAIAAQSAFFIILSFVPFVMFAFSLISIIFGKKTVDLPNDRLPTEDIRTFIAGIIQNAVNRSSSGTTIITALISLWSAGRGLYIITDGITRIYRLPDKQLWLIKRVYAMGYTAIMLIVMLLILGAVSLGIILNTKLNEIMDNLLPDWLSSFALYALSHLLIILFMTLALKVYLTCKKADKKYCTFRALLPGSIISVFGWDVLNYGVEIYTKHFATSSIYGSLGTVVVLMMLIYFMMFILLCGIQINFIYADRFNGTNKLILSIKTD